ncbi:MAG: hypothetical protein KGH53_03055 [Candidatus Micrarchaeota archaeon]|nr:hypothetical protein [Candidatus Micrarchaeota archaeon]
MVSIATIGAVGNGTQGLNGTFFERAFADCVRVLAAAPTKINSGINTIDIQGLSGGGKLNVVIEGKLQVLKIPSMFVGNSTSVDVSSVVYHFAPAKIVESGADTVVQVPMFNMTICNTFFVLPNPQPQGPFDVYSFEVVWKLLHSVHIPELHLAFAAGAGIAGVSFALLEGNGETMKLLGSIKKRAKEGAHALFERTKNLRRNKKE